MGDKMTILVVEDEPLVRMALAAQLIMEGFTIVEAANADEAVAILEQDLSIRVMFTDIDMPGSMDGIKLSAAVRDRWPPVKIILTSGHRKVDLSDLPQGSRFFSKPYRHAAVVSTIRELLVA